MPSALLPLCLCPRCAAGPAGVACGCAGVGVTAGAAAAAVFAFWFPAPRLPLAGVCAAFGCDAAFAAALFCPCFPAACLFAPFAGSLAVCSALPLSLFLPPEVVAGVAAAGSSLLASPLPFLSAFSALLAAAFALFALRSLRSSIKGVLFTLTFPPAPAPYSSFFSPAAAALSIAAALGIGCVSASKKAIYSAS